MPRYVIEREVPGAGLLSEDELQSIAQRSLEVMRQLGPDIQWFQTYVANDRMYCVYFSKNEELIREHARLGPFPVTRISRVETVIDPVTAEAKTQEAQTLEMAV